MRLVERPNGRAQAEHVCADPVFYVLCSQSTALAGENRRLLNLNAAVEFARDNNLLGVLVEGELLVRDDD